MRIVEMRLRIMWVILLDDYMVNFPSKFLEFV